jgi:hypothetical protein
VVFAIELRDTEVGELAAARSRDQHVLGLEIAMDDADVMGGRDTERDLMSQIEQVAQHHRPCLAVFAERTALDVLHDQVLVTTLVKHVVDLHDRGVVEASQDPRFAAKPLAPLRGVAAIVVETLDRDPPIEPLVVCEHDLAHPAGPEAVKNTVRTDPLGSHHRRHDHARR